jgi:hypothetical protein
MSGIERQITELAKQGFTADEIAGSLKYDIGVVATVLTRNGEVRNELEKSMPTDRLEKEFTGLEQLAMNTIKEIIQYGDKDSVRLAAATYVTDQRLGLKKPKATTINFNVFDLNERLREVRARKNAMEVEVEVTPVMT